MKLAIGTGKPEVPFSSAAVVVAATLITGWTTARSAFRTSSEVAADARSSGTGARFSAERVFGTEAGAASARAAGCVLAIALTGAVAFGVLAGLAALALNDFEAAAFPFPFPTLGFTADDRRLGAIRTFPAAMVLPLAFRGAARFALARGAAFFTGLRFAAMTA